MRLALTVPPPPALRLQLLVSHTQQHSSRPRARAPISGKSLVIVAEYRTTAIPEEIGNKKKVGTRRKKPVAPLSVLSSLSVASAVVASSRSYDTTVVQLLGPGSHKVEKETKTKCGFPVYMCVGVYI